MNEPQALPVPNKFTVPITSERLSRKKKKEQQEAQIRQYNAFEHKEVICKKCTHPTDTIIESKAHLHDLKIQEVEQKQTKTSTIVNVPCKEAKGQLPLFDSTTGNVLSYLNHLIFNICHRQ